MYDLEYDEFETSLKMLNCKNKSKYTKKVLYNIVSKLND